MTKVYGYVSGLVRATLIKRGDIRTIEETFMMVESALGLK